MATETSSSPDKDVVNGFEMVSFTIYSNDSTKKTSLLNDWTIINLKEELYSNSIFGYIRINDKTDIYNTFPLVAEEFVEIEFIIPSVDKKKVTTIVLAVNNVSDPIIDSLDKSKSYLLSLVSPESINSAASVINRASGFKPTGDMVKDILQSDEVNITKNKKIIENGNSSNFRCIFPNLHPFEAIKYVSKRSISKDTTDNSPWLFFERLNGEYVFDSVAHIIKTGLNDYDAKHDKLSKVVVDGFNQHTINWYTTIKKLTQKTDQNKVGQLDEGEIRSTAIEFDLLNKEVTKSDFNYKEDAINLLADSKDMFKQKEFSDEFLTRTNKFPGTLFLVHSDFSFNKDSEQNHKVAPFIGPKLAFFNSAASKSVTIEVPGNFNWYSGKVIYLDLIKSSGAEIKTVESDKRNTGFWCIEGINHEFNRKSMTTFLKLFYIGYKLDIKKQTNTKA